MTTPDPAIYIQCQKSGQDTRAWCWKEFGLSLQGLLLYFYLYLLKSLVVLAGICKEGGGCYCSGWLCWLLLVLVGGCAGFCYCSGWLCWLLLL